MLKETYNFLLSNIEDIKNKTLAVAYSGGIDSQVLLNIAYRLKDELSFNLIIIHVNYNLRGEDSTNDELFARDIAKKYNIEIYVKEIAPNSYNGKNIQLEARNDRYNFFKELYNKKIYDYLLIAHNKDDLVETIIYRMIKGAGTNVYKSLRDKKGYILRPILNFYRKDIEEYAKKIVEYAVTVAVMENDKIIAMANFYCNDIVTKICYATNVSITKKAQEKGYHIFDFAYAIMRIAQKAGMKKFCAETTDRRVFILHRRLGFVEIKREEINGIIHYYDCIEDIDAWLKKYSGQQITILNL